MAVYLLRYYCTLKCRIGDQLPHGPHDHTATRPHGHTTGRQGDRRQGDPGWCLLFLGACVPGQADGLMQGGHVFPRTIQISGSGPWSAFTNADLGSGFWVLGSGFWVLGFGILGEPRERNLRPLWLSLRLRMPRLECVVEVWSSGRFPRAGQATD